MQPEYFTGLCIDTSMDTQNRMCIADNDGTHFFHRMLNMLTFLKQRNAWKTNLSYNVQQLSRCLDGRPFGHNRHGPKSGEGLLWGRWVPTGSSSTQCGLGRGLPLYQVASWSIQPFGHNCRNATLLRVGIALRTIFIPSLVVTRQNIYSTRALSYCSIPNASK